MTDGFDFEEMLARGNSAGVPELYLVSMTPLPLTADQAAMEGAPSPLEKHYAYMHGLIEEGKVLAMGPCMGEPPVPGTAPLPPGIGILNVATREEAEDIARNEPFHTMGWRHNAVTAWTPKFGALIEVLRDTTGER